MGVLSSSKYKKLGVNIGLFAINAVATRLVTFLLVPLYTAFMTSSEYGITDMSLTVISLVTPLATLAAADAIVRFIVGDRANAGAYAFLGLAVTFVSIVLVAALAPILKLDVFGGLGNYGGWFVLAYATNALLQVFGSIARGLGRIRLIPICAGVSSLITCVLAVVLIGFMGMTVDGYFISVSVGPLVAIFIYSIAGGIGNVVFEGSRALLSMRGRLQRIKRFGSPMLRYALPLIPNSLFWWVGTSISRFFITGMVGISASGLFAAAGKIPNLLNTVYSIFQQAWQLSAFQESKSKDLEGFFSTVFRTLQAGMTILCALVSFLAPWIASVFLHGEFYAAWPMISILLIANLMNVFNSFYGTVYTTTMHTGYIMRTTVVGAITCVLLTPAFVSLVGVYGACAASAVSNASVFLMRAIDSRKYIRFNARWKTLVPTILSLVVQSAMTAWQVPGWQIVSAACLILCVVFQATNLSPLGRLVVEKVHSSR